MHLDIVTMHFVLSWEVGILAQCLVWCLLWVGVWVCPLWLMPTSHLGGGVVAVCSGISPFTDPLVVLLECIVGFWCACVWCVPVVVWCCVGCVWFVVLLVFVAYVV